jgi:hypothetical protein
MNEAEIHIGSEVGSNRPIAVPLSLFAQHCIIRGMTGAMKSVFVTYIALQIIEKTRACVIFVDFGGDRFAFHALKKAAVRTGRAFRFLSTSPTDAWDTFNPMHLFSPLPDECRHVLEALKVIYHNDAVARKRRMTPEKRLRHHRIKSQQRMNQLHGWMKRQLDQKLVEPNSALGAAIQYMLKRWDQLTLFLRKPGAPLDNNICERALKTSAPQWGRKDRLFDRRASDKSGDFRSFAGISLARSVSSRRKWMSDTAKRESPSYQLAA